MASYSQSKTSKLWSVRFRIVQNGKTVHKRLSGYTTKKEAQNAYVEFCTKEQTNTELENVQTVKFIHLINKYLDNQVTNVKSTSLYDIRNRIDNHITPFFGDMNVDKITPLTVLEWKQSKEHYSFAYKSKLLAELKAILRFAEIYYDFPPGLRAKITPFKRLGPEKEMQYWSLDEFRQFIKVIDNDIYKNLFYVIYTCGFRYGEALALKWENVDLENNVINVKHSLSRKVEGAAYILTTPKTDTSNRRVTIAPVIAEMLKAYRGTAADDEFVFAGSRPLPETTVTRYFQKYIKLAGVKRIRIHDLRHSCASLLISSGCSIVAVSKRLGHKDIRETLNTYSHMMPEDDERIISILNSAVLNSKLEI